MESKTAAEAVHVAESDRFLSGCTFKQPHPINNFQEEYFYEQLYDEIGNFGVYR